MYLEIRLEIQAITFKKKETSEGLLPTYFRGAFCNYGDKSLAFLTIYTPS
jgi:hypothetical protein